MEGTESSIYNDRAALVAALNAKLLREQNLVFGIIGGAVAALLGALLWMGITVGLEMHIGFVAIAIGAGVGFAVRYTGKGISKVFGVIGSVFTLLSCLAGEIMAVIQEAATHEQTGFFQVLPQIDFSKLLEAILENSSPITYIIYAIGIWEGYKFSFRQVTQQDIQEAGLGSAPVSATQLPPAA